MKFCPYCGADLVEDGVSFVLNAESSSLPARLRKKSLRINQKSKRQQRKRTLQRSRRAVSKSKRSWMMDMMDIMTISIRLTKDMSVKA